MQAAERQACTVVLTAALAMAAGQAPAQTYPTRPIRLVVSTTAGSQPDSLVRLFGQKLTESWGWAVVVDNRPGAGGTIAAGTVAKALPDGHTLFYALPSFTITAVTQTGLSYDPIRDFAPVTHVGIGTNVLVATPSLGVKSVKDLAALARAQPGKLIFGSGATGTAGHLTGVRFNLLAGIKVVHVAFKGGPEAMIQVLAGRTHYTVATMGVALPFVKEGRIVALGVTTPQRAPVLPDVPALGETLPEFRKPETSHGLLAPAGTPRAIVERVNREMARILALPDVKERLESISYIAAPSTPEEYQALLRAQLDALARLVQDAGLRPH